MPAWAPPYPCSPAFITHTPALPDDQTTVIDCTTTQFREPLYNRFLNAAGYLDTIVDEFLSFIDLSHNIVVITGDHGESFWDDGTIMHLAKCSDVQVRVSMLILGAGIPARKVTTPTMHADLLPTLLHAAAGVPIPIRNCHGVDLLQEPVPDRLMPAICGFPAVANAQPYLLAPGGGMVVTLRPGDPLLSVAGVVNSRGDVLPERLRDIKDWSRWGQAVRYWTSRFHPQ